MSTVLTPDNAHKLSAFLHVLAAMGFAMIPGEVFDAASVHGWLGPHLIRDCMRQDRRNLLNFTNMIAVTEGSMVAQVIRI